MNIFYHPLRRFRLKSLKIISHIFLVCILFFIISGCASSGGYQAAKYSSDKSSDLQIYGMFDKEYASTYFGSFRFIFENKEDRWLHIDNIRLSFPDDSANKYIKVLEQNELEQWGQAVLMQKNIQESTVKELQSALLTAGSSISSMVGDIGATVGLDGSDKSKTYPANHLYAENFMLPPGFTVEKWVLLESSHHEQIPYVTDLSLNFNVNKNPQKIDYKFREKSSKHENFIWFDPSRDVDLNFYLGVSIGSAFPMGDFRDAANRKENLINSFGLNGYLAILSQFGISFTLDYQGFRSRAKLDINPDSLFLPGTKFSFSDWDIFTFLISPRLVIPLSLDIDLFAELSLGLAMSASPTIIAERNGLEIAELEGERKVSFAGGGALGSRFYLSDKMNLDIKFEILPFIEPTFTYTLQNNQELDVTHKLSQFKIKTSLNWDL
jgi:hypothetical protein